MLVEQKKSLLLANLPVILLETKIGVNTINEAAIGMLKKRKASYSAPTRT